MENLLHEIKEVKETVNIDEVNSLIRKNWMLLNIATSNQKTSYLLGRISDYSATKPKEYECPQS